WIGIDFDSILRREDDDIVVDEGIWIVKVFMFTPDADESPLRQASSGLSHPIECPDWPLLRIQRDVEQISSAIRPVTGFERPVSAADRFSRDPYLHPSSRAGTRRIRLRFLIKAVSGPFTGASVRQVSDSVILNATYLHSQSLSWSLN